MERLSDVDPAAWTRFGPETPQVVYGPSEPQSRIIYDLEYFQTLRLYTYWKEHNIALKFVRERGEQQGLDRIWFDTGKEQIAVINHPKGTGFTFDPAAGSFDWEWQQMVAQLHNDDLQKVVEGSGGRSRGIIECSLRTCTTTSGTMPMCKIQPQSRDMSSQSSTSGTSWFGERTEAT